MLSFRVRVAGRADPDASQSFVKRIDGVAFRFPEQPAVHKCSERSSFATPWLSKLIVILYQTATVYGIAYASPSASQLSYTFPRRWHKQEHCAVSGSMRFHAFGGPLLLGRHPVAFVLLLVDLP